MKVLTIFVVATMVMVASPTAFASMYYNVDSDVSVSLTNWDDEYVLATNYRTHEFSLYMTNTSSAALTDVKYVLPFAWDGAGAAYEWVNADSQWHSDTPSGNDGIDGVYLKAVQSDGSAYTNLILMGDTNLPLSNSWKSPTQTLLSSDSVFVWDIDSSLAPGETVNFKMYLEQERDATISQVWIYPYAVAVPEPATMALLALGGLLIRKRK